MFKYLLAITVCLICLALLQQGCKGFGERFRKRIDERKQQRQERWGEWQENRFQRHENRRDPDPNDSGDRKHIFRHHWQRRRERSDADNGDTTTILIEDQ